MGKATKPRAKPRQRAVAPPTAPKPLELPPSPRDRSTPITDAQLALEANDDVEIATDAAKRLVRSQRQDVFALLYLRKSLTEAQYLACRRLRTDMLERAGHGDKVAIGGASDPARRALITDRAITAGECIDWIFGKARPTIYSLGETIDGPTYPPRILSPVDCRLLDELIEPKSVIGPLKGRWRLQVAIITGKRDAATQTEIVKRAAERLAKSYQAWDARPQRVDRMSRQHATA